MQQMSGGSMSGKVRVYEVAKQLNLDPKQVVGLFQAIGVVDVRNHMSSVEPEAVERVKRHLEKQRTHDTVEERIRPTVIKRRAIAKASSPGAAPLEAPSSTSLPSGPPSVRSLDEFSSATAETNGHAAAELAVHEPEIEPASIPEERMSVRSVEASPPPSVERPSAHRLIAPEAPVPTPPPPTRRTDDAVAAAAPAPVQELAPLAVPEAPAVAVPP
ncbi:MAG: translation initiation factor IF-2 N-terminal domain-containing protein, partial [Myxococcota bacterium]|nr:translation initiation factor IF-2 N-terminal domain-containing protein [Myxococcota bacterium]